MNARNIACYSLPKIGEKAQSSQDRYAHDREVSLIALADGAGSSLHPRKWAEILTTAFCESATDPIAPIRRDCPSWLAPLQEQWRQYYLERLQAPKRNWWEGGSQLKSHGSSTFLGLWLPGSPETIAATEPSPGEETDATADVDPAPGLPWQAVAVGDSCLFQWERQGDRLRAFPLDTAASFKSTTPCLASLPDYPSAPPQFATGSYAPGDRFLLATDALAKWILGDREAQGQQWQELFALKTQEEFATFVARLRQEKAIANDDTTALVIRDL